MQILLFAELRGEWGRLEALMARCREFSLDAAVFCGNIVRGSARSEEWHAARRDNRLPNRNHVQLISEAFEDLRLYKRFCHQVDSLGVPVLIVPGHLDAPEERYFLFMQQAAFYADNLVLLHESIVKVGAYIFGGYGGEITDDAKEDYFFLRYPRREAAIGTRRMHFINPPRILVFHTPPCSSLDDDGGVRRGHPFVNEMVQSVAPSLLFCGRAGGGQGVERIGTTVAVNPGALAEGRFAVVDSKERTARFYTL